MTRIDWIILNRLGSRILVTVVIFFGLIALVESLNAWRFQYLSSIGGTGLAVLGITMQAARWSIKTLPVTVLMGGILGMIDLQSRRELTVIKASGLSMWRVIRVPTLALFMVSIFVALGVESATTAINRTLTPTAPGESGVLTPPGELWLEQRDGTERYVLMANNTQPSGTVLNNVTVFFTDSDRGDRLQAPEAELVAGAWRFSTATLFRAEAPSRIVSDYQLPTSSTPADLRLRLSSTEDLTFLELVNVLTSPISDPRVLTAAFMRFLKLLTLPLLLTGSLFIAFAFTAGYRRTNNFGAAVLAGMVLGFLVFIITEMADRAGSAGVLHPVFAAVGPALVAMVIGLTVLLHREDGRI